MQQGIRRSFDGQILRYVRALRIGPFGVHRSINAARPDRWTVSTPAGMGVTARAKSKAAAIVLARKLMALQVNWGTIDTPDDLGELKDVVMKEVTVSEE